MIKYFKNKKTKGRKLKIIEKITVNEMFDFLEKHSIRPKISKVFTLDEIAKAHEFLEGNMANGKVVVVAD